MVWSQSKRLVTVLLWTGIVLAGAVLDSAANGLVIAPTRVMFEGRTRVATVYLTNRGDRETTYRISLRDKRMLESGQIVDIDEPTRLERPAADLVRYSPRRITLPAGGSQTVRLMLHNPSSGNLERGEYRTHLVFQSVPPVPENDDGSVTAYAILETSIPVIIRRDNPDAAIAFSSAALDTTPDVQGRPSLRLTLEREGLRSVYGDLTVDWVIDGKRIPVAKLAGLGVYHPTPRRVMAVPLTLSDDVRLDRGDFEVRFEETQLGRGDLTAFTTVDLPPEAAEE